MNIAEEYILALNSICVFCGVAVFIVYFKAIRNRLHDINRSGWWSILLFTPFLGAALFHIIHFLYSLSPIVFLIFFVTPIIFVIIIGCIDTKQEFNQCRYSEKKNNLTLIKKETSNKKEISKMQNWYNNINKKQRIFLFIISTLSIVIYGIGLLPLSLLIYLHLGLINSH